MFTRRSFLWLSSTAAAAGSVRALGAQVRDTGAAPPPPAIAALTSMRDRVRSALDTLRVL